MVDVKKRLVEGWLHCRVVIELIGKPKEHIEKTMRGYVDKIKKEKDIEVIDERIADIRKIDTKAKQEGILKEVWATFAELEMVVKGPMTLTYFCFDYMPSSVEIIGPEKLSYSNLEMTEFFNDVQSRLHQLDVLVKQMKSEVIFLRKSVSDLLKNFMMVLLAKGKLTADQLSKLTGVKQETLEDFLDGLVDSGQIKMEGENYFLKKDEK